jgi:hypothetical protein
MNGFVVIEGANDPALLSKMSQIQLYANTRSEQAAPGGGPVKVSPNGGFQIRGLRPGKVDISMATNPALGLSKLRIEQNGSPQPGGIDVGPGEHLENVRFVVGYGTGIIRGQVKIVGGALPEDFTLIAYTRRTGNESAQGTSGQSGQVDARGQFRIENLLPGEYELQLSVYSRMANDKRIPQFLTLLSQVRERLVVSNNAEAQATLVLDLGRKEGSQ